MEVPALIPTKYRSKVASSLSWPLGAQELSLAFSALPQCAQMSITFTDVYVRKTNAAGAGWLEVLRVLYTGKRFHFSASQEMIERGYMDPRWSILVPPVPRAERHGIRERLLPQLTVAAAHLESVSNHNMVNYTLRIIYDRNQDLAYCSSEQQEHPQRSSRFGA